MQRQISAEKQDKFINFFKLYSLGNWVYPGVLKRKTKIPIKEIYIILSELEVQGILKSYFEIICNECNKTEGEVYESIDDIPKDLLCEICGRPINSSKNTILIYKVTGDGDK